MFDVAIPVDSATFSIERRDFTIPAAPALNGNGDDVLEGVDDEETQKTYAVGDIDDNGHLILEDGIKATTSYTGKALVSEYTGSPASIPLLRIMEKAWAETHGYQYSEMDNGRFWTKQCRRPRPKTAASRKPRKA